MLSERTFMRIPILAALLLLPAAAAHADPEQEARSATAACLSAVIDGAPVGDVDGDDVTIRRSLDPVSCTVRVTGGEPVVIREAVQAAIRRRVELFTPARTQWDPEDFASRETFCNLSLRRSLNVFVSVGKPDRQPVAVVTVFESAKRDPRCDRDEGLQYLTAEQPVPAVTAAEVPTPETAAKPAKAKRRLLPRLPNLGKRKD